MAVSHNTAWYTALSIAGFAICSGTLLYVFIAWLSMGKSGDGIAVMTVTFIAYWVGFFLDEGWWRIGCIGTQCMAGLYFLLFLQDNLP